MSCGNCDSNDWKSAELVILEGSSTSAGGIDGKMTSPGSVSLNPRDWLLADRWFSYEYPINLDLHFNTITGLAEKVKKLMAEAGSRKPMPDAPNYRIEPVKPSDPRDGVFGFFRQLYTDDLAAAKINALNEQPLDLNETNDQGLVGYLLTGLATTGVIIFFLNFGLNTFELIDPILSVVGVGLNYFEFIDPILIETHVLSHLGSATDLYLSPGSFLGASLLFSIPKFFKYDKYLEKMALRKQRRFQLATAKRDKAISRLTAESERTQNANENLTKEIGAYEQDLAKYPQEIVLVQSENSRIREAYEANVVEVRLFRRELWDRARICQRCGNAYLAP